MVPEQVKAKDGLGGQLAMSMLLGDQASEEQPMPTTMLASSTSEWNSK
jgi:hypothetical protein